MSKAKELLLECKIKLGIETDYKLAQALEIHRSIIAHYMNEKRTPDAYCAVRIAGILKRDPAEIIATIEADSEKNPKRREFWRDFLQRATQAARRGMLVLLCGLTLWGATATAGGGFSRRKIYA
jgi:transcriptional regulator with XRE-family HTH domain